MARVFTVTRVPGKARVTRLLVGRVNCVFDSTQEIFDVLESELPVILASGYFDLLSNDYDRLSLEDIRRIRNAFG